MSETTVKIENQDGAAVIEASNEAEEPPASNPNDVGVVDTATEKLTAELIIFPKPIIVKTEQVAGSNAEMEVCTTTTNNAVDEIDAPPPPPLITSEEKTELTLRVKKEPVCMQETVDKENEEVNNSVAPETVEVSTTPDNNAGDDIEAPPPPKMTTEEIAKTMVRVKSEPICVQETAVKESEEVSNTIETAVQNVTGKETGVGQAPQSEPEPTAKKHLPMQIKTELTSTEQTETLPDNFFDDLMQSAEEIGAAAMSPQEPTTVHIKNEKPEAADSVNDLPATSSEAIPEHFFDDLLVDRVAERFENVINEEQETKYSDKLKELQNELRKLDEEESRSKSHKKHKKAKKKSSHKRDRSRDRERSRSRERKRKRTHTSPDSSRQTEIQVKTEPSTSNYGTLAKVSAMPMSKDPQQVTDTELYPEYPRPLKIKSEFRALAPTTSVYEEQLECLPVHYPMATEPSCSGLGGFKRIKLEKVVEKMPDCANEVEFVLTPKMKQERALKRAAVAINELQSLKKQKAQPPLSVFHYTATVRKLPLSNSYHTQQIYENRSPLHTVNNVDYKFNSHATRFNMREWGLEALPNVAAKVAKILGYDAQTLSSKLKATKLPAKLQKVKKEIGNEHGEEVDETCSSFFTNAMTQTDEVTVLTGRQRNGHDIGVQVRPVSGSISTQTTGNVTSSVTNSANDDLPLMKHMNELNENQLLALSDFAELIRETATSAGDMYKLRARMLEIYKSSQLPSIRATTIATPQLPVTQHPVYAPRDPRNNYINFDPRARVGNLQHQPQTIQIPTIDAYNRTHATQLIHPAYQQNPVQQHPPQVAQQRADSSTKFYGRGGSRR